MEQLPLAMLDAVSEADYPAVRNWWDTLHIPDQEILAWLYDERWEECFFGPHIGDESPPTVLGGRFLPHDDAWHFADWETDWREYRLTDHGIILATEFRSVCLLGDGCWGVRCRLADWNLTRFALWERPPSELCVNAR